MYFLLIIILSFYYHYLGKSELAKKLGAKEVLITSDKDAMAKANRTFDFIFDTVSAKHDLGEYIPLLKTDGTIVVVGGDYFF